MYGKIKEIYLKDACNEYLKRLSKYASISITELEDEKLPDSLSQNNINIVKERECNKIIDELNKLSKPYVIALDLNGKQLSSEDFANTLQEITVKRFLYNCLYNRRKPWLI